jgi:hypothetical protein
MANIPETPHPKRFMTPQVPHMQRSPGVVMMMTPGRVQHHMPPSTLQPQQGITRQHCTIGTPPPSMRLGTNTTVPIAHEVCPAWARRQEFPVSVARAMPAHQLSCRAREAMRPQGAPITPAMQQLLPQRPQPVRPLLVQGPDVPIPGPFTPRSQPFAPHSAPQTGAVGATPLGSPPMRHTRMPESLRMPLTDLQAGLPPSQRVGSHAARPAGPYAPQHPQPAQISPPPHSQHLQWMQQSPFPTSTPLVMPSPHANASPALGGHDSHQTNAPGGDGSPEIDLGVGSRAASLDGRMASLDDGLSMSLVWKLMRSDGSISLDNAAAAAALYELELEDESVNFSDKQTSLTASVDSSQKATIPCTGSESPYLTLRSASLDESNAAHALLDM